MAASDVFGIVGTTQAGNFHVERVVAEGGFGVVYRAQHGAFRAPVALKCLKIPEEMTKQQRALFLEKFREEAELMFRLSAAISEVVRPLHVDVLHLADGRFVPFLALEWLEGESLDGIITRRREQGQAPLGLHKVVKMIRPVASALARAHRFPGPQGAVAIIHRDLKPENIFVASIGGTESMKILDFGIAKAKRAASQAVGRATGRSIAEDVSASFTPAYGAPEQWSPKTYGETGPWTDVWGLALSTVEALYGAPPLDGDTYVMRRACLDEKKRPTPRNLGADVPVEVDQVFERALSVDPRKRFKDIESFWTELEKAMGLEPTLRVRDARREPGEVDKPEAPAPGPGPGARLARIDLLRVPSVANMPAVRLPINGPGGEVPPARGSSPGKAPPPPKSLPRGEASLVPLPDEDWSSLGLGDAPGRPRTGSDVARPSTGREVARPSTGSDVARPSTGRDVARPSTGSDVARPSTGRDVARPSTGSDVARPSTGRDVARPQTGRGEVRPLPASDGVRSRGDDARPQTGRGEVRPLPASDGVRSRGDDARPQTSRGQVRPLPASDTVRSRGDEARLTDLRAEAPEAAPPRKPPPVRRASIGLELQLPLHPEGPPEPASERVPGQGSPGAGPPPAPPHPGGYVRRHSMDLEMSLPLHPEGQPPPASEPDPLAAPTGSTGAAAPPGPAPYAPAPYLRRSSMELEASIPTMDAAPDPAGPDVRVAPRLPEPSIGSLEMSLPTMAAAPEAPAAEPARASRSAGGMDFELSGPARSRDVGPAPAPSASSAVAPARAPAGPAAPLQFRRPEPMTLRDRLKAPLGLLLSGLAVGLFDFGFHKISGNPLLLGPVRLSWIAAPLALSGVGFLLWRLIGVHEEDE
jgi:serine/threonine-protein kinase